MSDWELSKGRLLKLPSQELIFFFLISFKLARKDLGGPSSPGLGVARPLDTVEGMISSFKGLRLSQTWWFMSVIPVLGRLRQEDHQKFDDVA